LNTGSDTDTSYSFQVGSKDAETISISVGASSGWNLYQTSGTANANNGGTYTETGTATLLDNTGASGTRKVAASGFDVLSAIATDASGVVSDGPLVKIDAAIKSVDSQRSLLGASQNRFESAITNLNNTTSNLTAARSRIQDSDYATEVSNMSRAQILQQAGSSVLAQANQVPQT
ncbi:flagellin, partial [Phytobacter sp. V91]|uniref:flagellin n=1 Tax=Phytobacter sp. V91 TaxID=3369425 RepID=UPI003F646F9D